jgi:ADP-ribosylglycohydrolase
MVRISIFYSNRSDTSMALLLAESLLEKRGFHPQDQLTRYTQWYREGKLSSNGECFDIGTDPLISAVLTYRHHRSNGNREIRKKA